MRSKLNHPFVELGTMCVCESHLSSLPHEIFQVLPADSRGQVLHNQAVLGAHWRRVTTPAVLGAAAVAIRETSPSAAAATASAATAQTHASMLNGHPFIAQLFTIKLINSIFCISGVVKLHKAESSLQVYISDAAVSFEKPLHILLSGRGAQPADENTTSAHDLVTFN